MMQKGLLEEVKGLLESGLSPAAQSMQGIGYKELVWALKGEVTLEEAIELLKRNTRHLAKRQMTWFRANDKIRWFDATSVEAREKLCCQMESYSLGNF